MATQIEQTKRLNYKDSKRFMDRLIAVDRGEIPSMSDKTLEMLDNGVRDLLTSGALSEE